MNKEEEKKKSQPRAMKKQTQQTKAKDDGK
jgi:hypothetical protein